VDPLGIEPRPTRCKRIVLAAITMGPNRESRIRTDVLRIFSAALEPTQLSLEVIFWQCGGGPGTNRTLVEWFGSTVVALTRTQNEKGARLSPNPFRTIAWETRRQPVALFHGRFVCCGRAAIAKCGALAHSVWVNDVPTNCFMSAII
jgi:hypothetical protein